VKYKPFSFGNQVSLQQTRHDHQPLGICAGGGHRSLWFRFCEFFEILIEA